MSWIITCDIKSIHVYSSWCQEATIAKGTKVQTNCYLLALHRCRVNFIKYLFNIYLILVLIYNVYCCNTLYSFSSILYHESFLLGGDGYTCAYLSIWFIPCFILHTNQHKCSQIYRLFLLLSPRSHPFPTYSSIVENNKKQLLLL